MSSDGFVSGSYTTVRPRGSDALSTDSDRGWVDAPEYGDFDRGANCVRSNSVDRASNVEVEASVGVRFTDFGVGDEAAVVLEVSTAGVALCLRRE